MTASDNRAVVRCLDCGLNQYVPKDEKCRRCHTDLVATVPVEVLAALAEDASLVDVPALAGAASFSPAKFAAARRGHGLSQNDLADKMNKPRTYFSKIERGRCVPSTRNLVDVAAAIGCPVDDFLDDPRAERAKLERELLADAFLVELLPFAQGIGPDARAAVVSQAHYLSAQHREVV